MFIAILNSFNTSLYHIKAQDLFSLRSAGTNFLYFLHASVDTYDVISTNYQP